MKYCRALPVLAGVAVALAGFGLAACSSPPPPIHVKGTEEVMLTSPLNLLGGGGASDPLSDGDQVVVVDSSNKVIATSEIHSTDAPAAEKALSSLYQSDWYSFTLDVPGGLPRYGIQIGGTSHGTVWFSARQMETGPALSLDLTS